MSEEQRRKELAAQIKAVNARAERLVEHLENLDGVEDALDSDDPEEFDEIERVQRERDAARRYLDSTLEEVKRLQVAAEAMRKKRKHDEAMGKKQEHVEVTIEWPAGAPAAKQTMAVHPDYLVSLFGAVAFTVTLENGERVRFVRDAAADIGPRGGK